MMATKKTIPTPFNWQSYLSKNWQPLGIGVLIGFVLRELLVVALLAAIVYVVVVLMNKKNTEKVKQ